MLCMLILHSKPPESWFANRRGQDASTNAGFSSKKPWLPVHPDYTERNVEAQNTRPDSMLNFTRNLIKLRRENPALLRGDFTLLTETPKDTLAYLRQTLDQSNLVALNFRNYPASVQKIPEFGWDLLFSTARETVPINANSLDLAPYEVLILESV